MQEGATKSSLFSSPTTGPVPCSLVGTGNRFANIGHIRHVGQSRHQGVFGFLTFLLLFCGEPPALSSIAIGTETTVFVTILEYEMQSLFLSTLLFGVKCIGVVVSGLLGVYKVVT